MAEEPGTRNGSWRTGSLEPSGEGSGTGGYDHRTATAQVFPYSGGGGDGRLLHCGHLAPSADVAGIRLPGGVLGPLAPECAPGTCQVCVSSGGGREAGAHFEALRSLAQRKSFRWSHTRMESLESPQVSAPREVFKGSLQELECTVISVTLFPQSPSIPQEGGQVCLVSIFSFKAKISFSTHFLRLFLNFSN